MRHIPGARLNKAGSLALGSAGIILVASGSYGLYQRFTATHSPQPHDAKQIVGHTDSHPSEAPINDDYTVDADMPRRIIMPTIDTKAYIQKVLVDQHQTIATPNNVNLAGWYVKSPKPGQSGVSIIDGHVQGRYSPGAFKRLAELKTGDDIHIEYGDHKLLTFEVVSVDNMPVDEAGKQQYVQLAGTDKQMTIITCAGTYDKASSSYDQRTLVRTQLKI
jgi:LPXTG-site transpeptidase (sortase) family protein